MIIVNMDSTCVRSKSIYQYDYGAVLRLQGAKLPTAVEIQFSFEERGGQSKSRIGITKDGVTDVVIPDLFVENNFTSQDYKIYVFIYLTDENSGRTEYKITIPVKSRPELEAFDKPEDAELFREAIAEVNKSAESASESATRSETAKDESVAAAKGAKQSAQEASTSAKASKTSADASKESENTANSAASAAINAKEIAGSAAGSAEDSALAASRSEQEAKQSAEQADTAAKSANESKQAIEQLKTAIDTTAEQIATDRTAVETDKKEVQKAKSAVEDLKGAIEQKSSEAITNIGTAKDNAIKDVNTTKNTAVSAITQEKESAVNAVNEAKDNVVAEINKNENVQQIQKNKDSVEELKKDVDQLNDKKITKFYANNLGETYLQDSDTGKIQDMVLYGKSEQKQYSGKNLLKYPYYDTETTSAGITYIINEDGSVTMQGTAISASYFSFATKNESPLTLPAGSYKLIVKGRNNSNVVVSNDSNTVTNQGILELTEDINKVCCYIYISKNTTVNETIYPMLQSTDYQDEDYEPYVGGIPSPNVEYPQEIKNIVNPVMKIIGKNLLDVSKLINKTINGVEFTPETDGALIANGTATNNVTYNIVSNFAIKAGTYAIKGCKAYYRTIDNKTGWFGTDKNTFTVATFDSDALLNILIFIPTGATISETLKPMLIKGNTAGEFEKYKEQVVSLQYKLNAMPVTAGGNITIDGQQYIADYVDAEKGKYIQRIQEVKLDADFNWNFIKGEKSGNYIFQMSLIRNGYTRSVGIVNGIKNTASSHFCYTNLMFDDNTLKGSKIYTYESEMTISFDSSSSIDSLDKFKQLLNENEIIVQYVLAEPIEHDLSEEDINKLKNLETYYDVTNIEVTSDQLDGYTTFNYPISLANGWDYVKQQLGDTRDYIYDMDVKAQDIDTQSAEAYVNSEYAVALTELEVM